MGFKNVCWKCFLVENAKIDKTFVYVQKAKSEKYITCSLFTKCRHSKKVQNNSHNCMGKHLYSTTNYFLCIY